MGKHNGGHGDIESGFSNGALYPNMIESPQLRWAFIRKVYVILSMQFILTAVVCATVTFYRPIPEFFLSGKTAALVTLISIIVGSLLVMILTMCFRKRHPINMVLLGLFTICQSVIVGLACATKSAKIVLEATALTAIVVVALTLYTFWAASRGYDFKFLGPFLFVSLLVLSIYSFVQIFLPVGVVGHTIFACISALIFAGFIIYDTDELIKRHSYDEYISASLDLYLDIINLFLNMLMILDASE